MTLTLKYRSSRAEVWRWYWRAWRRPRGLWRFHVLIFLMVAGSVLLNLSGRRPLMLRDVGLSAIIGLLVLALMPLWPMIRFKPHERVLSLDERGVSTTIGTQSGVVLWSKVALIEDGDGVISITGKTGNAFLIPDRAFSNPDARVECLKTIHEWHSAATRQGAPLQGV